MDQGIEGNSHNASTSKDHLKKGEYKDSHMESPIQSYMKKDTYVSLNLDQTPNMAKKALKVSEYEQKAHQVKKKLQYKQRKLQYMKKTSEYIKLKVVGQGSNEKALKVSEYTITLEVECDSQDQGMLNCEDF